MDAASSTDDTPGIHRQAPTRALLVGTQGAVHGWAHAMLAMTPRPTLVGCLLCTSQNANEPASADMPAVLGGWDRLEAVVAQHHVDQVYLTLPATRMDQARELARRVEALDLPCRFLLSLEDQLANVSAPLPASLPGVTTSQATTQPHLDLAQLIAREPHPLDEQAIRRTLHGKVVLITGSGGSIGSELARRVAGFGPRKLVLVERSENALFEIDRQVGRLFPDVARSAVLHDVTHTSRTRGMVIAHRPEVIFHAAAHKHVPMMEEHPADAVENNFYGTRSIADAAAAQGVERFVMISSDKAVNPSSVMGATKRLAELYIQHLNRRSDTLFSMVRFGNVLGSACSVLPIWTQQLAHGGPVTVTSPQMVRYFMTIPEAAGLVLQSASLAGEDGQGAGEVFLLDMGQPVRILDLARRFIRAHGLEPEVDIPIQITGVRPGEKLFEELAYHGEDMLPTPHKAIRIWRSATPPDTQRMGRIIASFDELRDAGQADHPWQHAPAARIHQALRQAIPEMVEPATDATIAPTAPQAPPVAV